MKLRNLFFLTFIFTLFFSKFSFSAVDVFQYPINQQTIVEAKKIIPQVQTLRGKFVQTKKIEGISKNLISEGNFLFSKENGIYWQTTKPFLLTLVFGKNAVIQIQDGQKELISANNQVFFREFSKIFQSIFLGDYDKLKEYFDVFFVVNNEEWTLGLKPNNDFIKDVMTAIIISGNKNINEVEIREKFDDKTIIKFHNISQNPLQLTSQEKSYFEF